MIVKVDIPTLRSIDIRLIVEREGDLWYPIQNLEFSKPIFGIMLKDGRIWDAIVGWEDAPHRTDFKERMKSRLEMIKNLQEGRAWNDPGTD